MVTICQNMVRDPRARLARKPRQLVTPAMIGNHQEEELVVVCIALLIMAVSMQIAMVRLILSKR